MKKFMQVCLCILLITCVMGTTMINAYCAPFLLLLEAPAFIAIVKGLIAAGLVFGASYGIYEIQKIVNEYWQSQTETIRQHWVSYGVGAITIGLDVWNSLRAFVQGKVTAEGAQSIPISTQAISFPLTNGNQTFTVSSIPQVAWGDNGRYSYYAIIGMTDFGVIQAMYIADGSTSTWWDANTNKLSITPATNYGCHLYSYMTDTNTWNYEGQFYGSFGTYKNIGRNFMATNGNYIYYYKVAQVQGYDNTQYAYFSNICPKVYDLNNSRVSVSTGALSPTYDYTHTQTGEKTIYVPTDISETNVQTYTETLTDTTAGDIAAEEVPVVVPETGTLAGVISAVQSVAQSVERFFDTSQTINWQPLVVVGGNLKSIFPFSLPWDLYGLIARLDYPPVEPVINIHIAKSPLMPEMNWKMDMTQVKPYFAILRTMELFIFFIVLIMKTRTLMGGDV